MYDSKLMMIFKSKQSYNSNIVGTSLGKAPLSCVRVIRPTIWPNASTEDLRTCCNLDQALTHVPKYLLELLDKKTKCTDNVEHIYWLNTYDYDNVYALRMHVYLLHSLIKHYKDKIAKKNQQINKLRNKMTDTI